MEQVSINSDKGLSMRRVFLLEKESMTPGRLEPVAIIMAISREDAMKKAEESDKLPGLKKDGGKEGGWKRQYISGRGPGYPFLDTGFGAFRYRLTDDLPLIL